MVWWMPGDGLHEFHILRHYYVLSCTFCCVCDCRSGRVYVCVDHAHEWHKKPKSLRPFSVKDLSLVSST